MTNSETIRNLLAKNILKKQAQVEQWVQSHAIQCPPPFYSSIDLRDAGYKIAPVDCNIYPAGFNNLCPDDWRSCPPLFKAELDRIYLNIYKKRGEGTRKPPEKVLLIPESHTQNKFYIENLYSLFKILENAGYQVQIGWYSTSPAQTTPESQPISLVSETGKTLTAYPLHIRNGLLTIADFIPDLILLNNDFSGGYPFPLDEVCQPIIPSYTMGWHSRKKANHFHYYNELASELATLLEIDPWHIQIDTEEVSPVNFNENIGLEQVLQKTEDLLNRQKQQFLKHQIQQEPFVFIKNNSGTYGMGIMTVHSIEELKNMNRRTRNKMSVGKGRSTIESVIIQEGIPTQTRVDQLAAEPVIYSIGTELIGGFIRTNTERGSEENLNSQGMIFKKLCMSDLRKNQSSEHKNDLEIAYGSIARLCALAAGRELSDHLKNKRRVTS